MAQGASQVDFLLAGLRDTSGNPLAGGNIYTYEPGTTTNKTTWQNQNKTTPHANPIILDAQGQKLVFADGEYKFLVKDSADNTLYTWDNLVFQLNDEVGTWGGLSGGSSGVYTIAPTPAKGTLESGDVYRFQANHTNPNGTATLNVNGLGAYNILKPDRVTLRASEIVLNGTYEVIFNGTEFVLLTALPAGVTYTPTIDTQAGSLTNTTIYHAHHTVIDSKLLHLAVYFSTEQLTAASNYLTVSSPYTLKDFGHNTSHAIGGLRVSAGAYENGYAWMVPDSTTIQVYRNAAAQWPVAAGHEIRLNFVALLK